MVDHIVGRLRTSARGPSCRPTRQAPLPGGHTGPLEAFVKSATERAAREYRLQPRVAERIVRTYGSRWPLVLARVTEEARLAEPLPGSPTLLPAEVDFAIRHEMAVNLEDFLLRRSGLNWTACTLREAVPAVAEIFATRFGWSIEQRQSAVDHFSRCACAPIGK